MSLIRKFKLEKETELRIEVGSSSSLRVRVVAGHGTAEIFGAELPPSTWVPIPARRNIAIFTWEGATVEVDGVCEVRYVADETPMVSYVNVHAIIDARRIRAARAAGVNLSQLGTYPSMVQHVLFGLVLTVLFSIRWMPMVSYVNVHAIIDARRIRAAQAADVNLSQGPRVMVVGPTDSGKNSLSTMLLNWACKHGWKPTFLDLDIGQGSITIPGCVAATPVKLPVDAGGRIPLESPLVYFYGHTSLSGNMELYKVLLKELAKTVDQRFSKDKESRAAGMVINTMGWDEGVGYELLLHAIDTFNANIVLVLGQEKLYSMLKRMLNIDVVKLHKSGGVVPRNPEARQQARNLRIREYFYGLVRDLSPCRYTVNFSDVSIYQIGNGPPEPSPTLRIGAEPIVDPIRLVTVSLSLNLLQSILAVSYAEEPNQILSSSVAGFIHVTSIDLQRKKFTYLAPCSGELPSRLLLAGTLTWSDN